MSNSQIKHDVGSVPQEALHNLVEFARFLDKHPEDPDFKGRWLQNLNSRIESWDEARSVQQRGHIVCVLDHGKQKWSEGQPDRIDLIALPFDILYCRDPESSDNLEPVFPVNKMLRVINRRLQWKEIWDKSKNDEVLLVILSYSTSTEAQDFIKDEADSAIQLFKCVLSIEEDKVLKISREHQFYFPIDRYTEKAENARIIWIHNMKPPLVKKYIENLPSNRNLILYYIGPVNKRALTPPTGRISATKLKRWFDWPSGSKTVNLFYVSPHQYDCNEHEVFLEYGQPSFVRELLNEAVPLAALVWFRWSLPERDATEMAQSFFDRLVDKLHAGQVEVPGFISEALLAAKNELYKEWNNDPANWCYYAWAAPVLISQGFTASEAGKTEYQQRASEISQAIQV